jgi:hypothetical protein
MRRALADGWPFLLRLEVLLCADPFFDVVARCDVLVEGFCLAVEAEFEGTSPCAGRLTGMTASQTESRPASHREQADLGVAGTPTFIFPLYASFD